MLFALGCQEKDAVALRRVVDDAIAQGVELQGLETARRKLLEWEGTKALRSRLRIVLPDGRKGWLPVDEEWTGQRVLQSLALEAQRAFFKGS